MLCFHSCVCLAVQVEEVGTLYRAPALPAYRVLDPAAPVLVPGTCLNLFNFNLTVQERFAPPRTGPQPSSPGICSHLFTMQPVLSEVSSSSLRNT